MQASDALPSAPNSRQADSRGLPASSSAMSPAVSSVISPATSAYGFGDHMESPALSQAGGEGDDAEAAKRRTNPLIDLIESEKRYVDELGMVIRKVAGAWSRQNFPPPLLDLMFRSIEGVYKINRGFGSKLKEIGPNPSSPKALGDLLMRWIDDMEPAYKRYCSTYLAAYDGWQPVQETAALHPILADVSGQLQGVPSFPSPQGGWTLDSFFILPYQRLRYYKKLYARLLKSTQPGRSDHNLLIGANERLDVLLELVRGRLEMTVENEGRTTALPAQQGERTSTVSSTANSRTSDQSVFSQNGRDSSNSTSTSYNSLPPPSMQQIHEKGPTRDAHRASDPDPLPPPPVPRETLMDVERRLVPDRTMDLFTMKPRMVRLQISPPGLPFARQLRSSVPVEISFTPTSTGRPVVHRKAHIFLLSDLFLMCEYMDEKDRLQKAAESTEGRRPDLWLSYPPLAGKHLQAQTGPTPNSIDVLVMKKERFQILLPSPELQAPILRDFHACIDFANSIQLAIQQRSAAGLPPSVSPGFSTARNSPASSIASPTNLSSQQSFPPAPLQKQHPGQQRVVSQAPSQTSTYSNHSSGGAPSINRQMDQMSIRSHQSPSSPALPQPPHNGPGYGGARPLSPPQYGQHNGGPPPPAPPPLPPPAAPLDAHMPPPRGASLGQAHAAGRQPVRQMSGGPPPGAHYQPQPGNHLKPGQPQYPGQPLQPGQQLRPGQPMGPPFPQYNARPPPPGPNMSPTIDMARSHSSPSERMPGSGYVQNEPPLPPPSMMQRGHPERHSPQLQVHPANSSVNGGPGGEPPLAAFLQSPARSLNGAYGGPPTPVSYGTEGASRSRSTEPLTPGGSLMPSAAFAEVRQRAISTFDPASGSSTPPEEVTDLTPPPSPSAEQDSAALSGPAEITAQMKCKVFLKRNHAQWKSIGPARLKLYHQQSTNVKQIVVESDGSSKTMLISTIVLTDGVERVGKTGVAIEISDQGRRTGVIYMIQLRNEQSAGGLFDSLLAGTGRSR